MKIKDALLLMILLTSIGAAAAKANAAPNEGSPEAAGKLRLVNAAGGAIEVSRDGLTWQKAGSVLAPAERVNDNGYTASAWATDGSVAATAVNAIHIRTGISEKGRGIIFSLLPRDFFNPPAGYKSYLSPTSSIYTDIPAGSGIFGAGWSPAVGNPVLKFAGTEGEEGLWQPLPPGYVPAQGDRLMIVMASPAQRPTEITFENREGGRVTASFADGSSLDIAVVIKPVAGIGRFEGSIYTGTGRIRANHCGVICISTSPFGSLGGFQIIPAGHSHSPEMEHIWSATQWMVVAPLENQPSLEGRGPLFSSYIYPSYSPDDLYAPDWKERLLDRFLVQAKLTGQEDWQPLPTFMLDKDLSLPLPAWAREALADITDIRISFPLERGKAVHPG